MVDALASNICVRSVLYNWRMPKLSLFVDVGQRIGRGVVLEAGLKIPRRGRPAGSGMRAARLRCDCGNEYVTSLQALVGKRAENQRALSCGCLRRERQIAAATTHGMASTGNEHPLLKIWEGMIHRCESPGNVSYHHYGGRGITVCERWHDPLLFAEDISRDLGPRPAGWSLDRIDTNGDYQPGNVRWASSVMQAQNRRPRAPEVASAVGRTPWENRPYRTVTCLHCGGEYQTRAMSPNQKYCSKKCSAAARRAATADSVQLNCHVCGGTYSANKYDEIRHCSHSCAATCQHADGCPVAA